MHFFQYLILKQYQIDTLNIQRLKWRIQSTITRESGMNCLEMGVQQIIDYLIYQEYCSFGNSNSTVAIIISIHDLKRLAPRPDSITQLPYNCIGSPLTPTQGAATLGPENLCRRLRINHIWKHFAKKMQGKL